MPPVSEKQRRAMGAAAGGKSTLGIPKKVGMEMMDGPKARGRSMPASHGKMSEAEHKRMMKKKRKSPVLSSHRY